MRKAVLLIAGCCFTLFGYSQSDAGLTIHVTDSSTKTPLPGARITLVSGRDTTVFPTNERGIGSYAGIFRSDSVGLTVHYLGYNTKQVVLPAPGAGVFRSVYVDLVENPREIAEIVVVGKSVAVVMRGDTVQFNAEAFRTFANDPMSQLFAMLPGMELKDGQLTYLGETISRVTVDGQRLFDGHTRLAMENIRADDVVGVSVYKEASDQDKLDSVANPALRTVVDVQTKSKPSMIRRVHFAVAAGSALDQTGGGSDTAVDWTGPGADRTDDVRKTLYQGSGSLAYTRVGETLSTSANIANMGTGAANYKAYRNKQASLTYSRQESNRYRYSTENAGGWMDFSRENWVRDAYFPTSEYRVRSYQNEQFGTESRKGLSSRNDYQHTFKNRDVLGGKATISYSDQTKREMQRLIATQDDQQTQNQYIRRLVHETPLTFLASGAYSKRIKSGRVNLSVEAHIADQAGDGWRLDTLASSTSQIYLEDTRSARSQKYSVGLGATQTLTPTISLTASHYVSFIESESQQAAVDMLTGIVDFTNTFDDAIEETNNNARMSLTYRDNQLARGFREATVDLNWEHRDMQRNERFPAARRLPRTFNLLSGGASLAYHFSTYNTLNFKYDRRPVLSHSVLDYQVFDDSNPLELRAGNPDLGLTVDNVFSAEGRFIAGASTFELTLRYTTVEGALVRRVEYFEEDTYLPQYDYTALAGTTLSTLENLSGAEGMLTDLRYSVLSMPLLTNIRVNLSHNHSNTPAYVNGERAQIGSDVYRLGLHLIGNFSTTLMPSISSTTMLQRRDNGQVSNEWLAQSLGLHLRAMLWETVDLNTNNNLDWNINWPDVPGVDRFGFVSNLSAGYLFDKQGNLKLSVNANDLWDRRQHVRVAVDNEFIRRSYGYQLGRYFLMRLDYKF